MRCKATFGLKLLLLAGLVQQAAIGADSLEDMSLEDLTKAEITSVARRSQSVMNVPAAAFVISSEDIRRSGAMTLPDVLRMVPGIEVAQIDNGRYAVTARGFNGRFANKLQVLIDGRSIYSPMFSGVMWENDPVALEDIERIEVIRGPGAAMWGVNAVNGVINIISKHSRNQTGGIIAPAAGSHGAGGLYARYGAEWDADTTWKLSFQGRHAEPSRLQSGGRNSDDRLDNGLIDFRFDRNLGADSSFSVWGGASRTEIGDRVVAELAPSAPFRLNAVKIKQVDSNQVAAGRYRWLTAGGIESSVQGSIEDSTIEIKDFFRQDRTTVDLEYQGRYLFAGHDLLWGLGHRTSHDSVERRSIVVSIRNPEFTERTTGVFIHDDWTLIRERLQLGIGARWDNSNYAGSVFAPNLNLMWTPSRNDTLWFKFAKAPRMPSRGERDISVLVSVIPAQPPASPLPVVIQNIPGSAALKPENMKSYELGYRTQPFSNFSVNLAVYRQHYTDLRSGQPGALDFSLFPLAIIQRVSPCNCSEGWVHGAEFAADWLVLPRWRLQFSYTWSQVDMEEGSTVASRSDAENLEKMTPRQYGSLRSQWNISSNQQLDAWIRGSAGVHRVNVPFTDMVRVPGYVTLDLRYAHRLNKALEIALIGRNLIGSPRMEYVSDYIPSPPTEIRPSAFVTARWNF